MASLPDATRVACFPVRVSVSVGAASPSGEGERVCLKRVRVLLLAKKQASKNVTSVGFEIEDFGFVPSTKALWEEVWGRA
ncbi:MAG: hypothetical protein V7K48_05175 [Nostoc sp.]